MSTILVPVDNTWQNVQAGPQTSVSVSATGRKLFYQLIPTAPPQVEQGHTLNPGDGVGLSLTGSDNLWVRVSGVADSAIAVTL